MIVIGVVFVCLGIRDDKIKVHQARIELFEGDDFFFQFPDGQATAFECNGVVVEGRAEFEMDHALKGLPDGVGGGRAKGRDYK